MNLWLAAQAKRLFFRSLRDLRCGFLEIVLPRKKPTRSAIPPCLCAPWPSSTISASFFAPFPALTSASVSPTLDGDWSSPDLVALVRLFVRNLRLLDDRNRFFSAVRAFFSRPLRHRLRANTIKGSRKNISAHYDLGNEFYRIDAG